MAGDEGRDGCCALGRVMSLSDMVLGFFENGEGNPESYRDGGSDSGDIEGGSSDEGSDGFGSSVGAEERKAFWGSQHQVLQVLLSRNSSLETQIRRETEAAIRHLRSEAGACSCSRNAANECRECLLRGVTERLRDAGYNSAVCNSKWTTSSSIPKGEHTYIDVVEAADGTKGPVRVVIEVCFRAEFEMARASEEYRRLVYRLPEVFVGKPEKLRGVIKTVCAAAKKCMEDNKMHMAPWRKSKYMQAKWLTPCEREPPRAALSPTEAAFSANRHRKPQASMLTFDLLDKLPGLHWPAVRVL